MSALEAAEEIFAKLTRAEKAQLLRWAANDLSDAFPGIESRPGVCGGEPCIVRTRIPVWVLEQARRLGVSEAELLRSYPTLRAEDLANAWAYVRSHRDGIIVCTVDPNFARQAERIHQAVGAQTSLRGQLIRVNRPSVGDIPPPA